MAPAGLVRRPRLDWPLLGKELREQAARRQMYVIRVVYAVVLFGAFCFYYLRHLGEGPLTLGRGLAPFEFLVSAQLVTIYLFLPPLMAGAIAREKERDTLGLLFLTDLTPWELILQKYFGRLIPMLTLLFLSLPLLAVAYSLGGVPAGLLYASAATLFITCLGVGALALECSAHEATTFQALLRCWGLCLGFNLCCLTLVWPDRSFSGGLSFFAPGLFTSAGYLFLTWLLLTRARHVLESRAFVQRQNPFAYQFKQLDQYWKDIRKLLRAMSRRQDREAVALARQVVRRGLNAGAGRSEVSLGEYLLARMQVPNLLAFPIIFGVIVLIALITNMVLEPKSGGAFYLAVGGLWLLAFLTISIQSANAVANERMNERLGPLLTTCLTGPEILEEWLGPVRRWTHFLSRPLIVIVLIEGLVKFLTQNPAEPRGQEFGAYLGLSLAAIFIYPALMCWFCLWIGLRIPHQVRALMTALLVTAAWCLIPLAAPGYLAQTGLLPSPEWGQTLGFLSPVSVIATAESIGRRSADGPFSAYAIVLACFQLVVAAGLAWFFRRLCLTRADAYLGRI